MKEFITKIDGEKTYVRYNDLPGDKIPLVFIPGWGCAGSFDFIETASQKGLEDHRRILIDLLGAGYSDSPRDFDYLPESHAAYIVELLDDLGLDRLVIYAHSMGGRIAIALAELLGDRLEGMILAEGSMVQEYFPYMGEGEEKFVQEYFHKMLRSLARKEDQQFLSTVRLCLPEALYREAREMMSEDSGNWERIYFKGDYGKVFIVGEETDDEGFDLENIRVAQIPIISIPQAGHTMNWDLPLETSQAILGALEILGL